MPTLAEAGVPPRPMSISKPFEDFGAALMAISAPFITDILAIAGKPAEVTL